jgi:hypothetical protein
MMTRNGFVWATFMLLPLAGGCNSRFAGEWLQESVVDRTGTVKPVTGERRLALQFIPPSTVRLGSYSDAARTVEVDSVSSSDYQTIQNRTIAQFGTYTARVEDGQLVTFVGENAVGRFQRLSGKSVFPPLVTLPRFVRSGPSREKPSLPATVATAD